MANKAAVSASELLARLDDVRGKLADARAAAEAATMGATAAYAAGRDPAPGAVTVARERVALLERTIPELATMVVEAEARESDDARAAQQAAANEAASARAGHIRALYGHLTAAAVECEAAEGLLGIIRRGGARVMRAGLPSALGRDLERAASYLASNWPEQCGHPARASAAARAVAEARQRVADLERELRETLPDRRATARQREETGEPWGGWEGIEARVRAELADAREKLKAVEQRAKEQNE